MFHRGIGTERITGMLIDSKLDLLMDYTVFYLLDMIKAPFSKDKKDQGAAADKGAAASKTTQQAAAAAAGSSQTRAAGSGMVSVCVGCSAGCAVSRLSSSGAVWMC